MMEKSEERRFFDRFFRSAPAEIDVEAIRQAWLALPAAYGIDDRRLPLPVWARRGLNADGDEAWNTLRQEVGRIAASKPFCIYVHIPFCATRCAFCDCYSFPLRRHRDTHVESYLDLLAQEMRLWSQLGSLAHRPVSTVHFGGGTPTFLPEDAFHRLVRDLRGHFNTGPETEWALESTTSELDQGMMSALNRWGFSRLHVGVQSLEDNVRRIIGRREPADVVLEKIARAVAADWVVSVDLILGLPQQTLGSVVGDIEALEAVGVDGFSLYELQRSPRNRRFIKEHGLAERGRLPAYLLTQTASRLLASLGYRKTLFNHFARDRDTNLYFTFPERGEDCLALGTIADGVFADYHYRHPGYKAYCQQVSDESPGLLGGLRRSALESRLFPLEVSLLSGSISPGLFADVLGKGRSERLFRRWREASLIKREPPSGSLRLTVNGSWFVSLMMADLAT
jgi:oxygen-independent coproporphyrinogen-3 oxidase